MLTSLALSDYGIVFAIPYGSLAAFVAVAIAAGMLARDPAGQARLPPQRLESTPVRVKTRPATSVSPKDRG